MISTIYIMARRWKRCKFFGPGKFLFSRALKQELRMQHELQVLIRHLAQKMLQNKYPEWLDLACHLQKRRTEKKISFEGLLNVVSRNVVSSQSQESVWVSKLDFCTRCIWMSWHLFQKELIFMRRLLELKYYYWEKKYSQFLYMLENFQDLCNLIMVLSLKDDRNTNISRQ